MTRWFDLKPCGEGFFDTASHRRSYTVELPAPPADVWAGLTGVSPLAWCRLLGCGRYTSPRPFGVGTTREITAARTVRLREEFLRWEEGRRHSFWVTQSNVPLFRRFAEDYLVEPAPGGTRFTWTFAFEPAPVLARPAALTLLPAALVFRSLIGDTTRHFARR